MPTMLNPRSQALLNANPRLLTSPNSDVLLSASTPIFHVSNTGDNTPAIITFNAILIAMEGTVTFSCNGGTLTNIVGNTAALNYENMPGDNATVTATITYRNQTYSDSVEISKIYDGAAGGSGLNTALVYAYQRSNTMPSGSPGAVEYSYTAVAITTTPLANGWQKTIPSGTLPLWITAASASSSSPTDTIGSNEWSSPVILAQNGLDGVSPALLSLAATSQSFTYNSTGTATPANQTITFTAKLVNTTGTATFTCTKYDASGANIGTVTLGGTGNTRTLTDAQFTTSAFRAVITATLGTQTDTITVVRLADGAAGSGVSALAGYLTNESVNVPTASDGSSPVLTGVTGNFKVFQGTTDVTSGCTFSVVGTPLVTTSAPTAGTGAYSVTGVGTWPTGSLTTSVTYRALHTASGATIDQVLTITKAPAGAQGANGINSATVTLYQRTSTTTAPSNPSATTTYTFNPPGITGVNNGWSTTIPASANGKYLWATTATGASTTATDTIAASEWATPQMLAQDGNKGDTGPRGNVQVARAIPGSTWSDSEAALAISGAGYGVPQNRDIVTLYNNSASYSQQKYYDGSAWQVLAAYFPGGVIVDGTVDATALKAKTITGDKIAAGAITATNIVVSGNTDNIIPDPRFKDLNWWGRVGSTVAQFAEVGQITDWKGGASLYLNESPGELFSESKYFDLLPGATYRIELQVSLSSDFNGRASVFLFIPGDRYYGMVDRDSGLRWSDNQVVQLNSTSSKGLITYSSTYTIPSSGTLSKGLIQVRNSHTVGVVEVGSVSITRVADSVLIKDGAITADKIQAGSVTAEKINVTNLTTVSTFVGGDLQLGANGRIRQGATDYNSGKGVYLGAPAGVPKFFVGTAGAANIRWSEADGLRIDSASLETYAASFSGSVGGSYPNGSTGYGFLTANTSGGKAPYTYVWTLTERSRTGAAGVMNISNTNQQSASFSGSGTNATLEYDVRCVVTDANQRSITLGVSITANHGTPP